MTHTERVYPVLPVVGVGAILVKDGRVLLVRSAADSGGGEWRFPGGLVRIGEALADAVERELRESCRVDVEVGPALMVSERIETDEEGETRHHVVTVDHLISAFKGKPVAGIPDFELRWCTPEEAKALGVPSAVRASIKSALGV